MRSLIIFLGCMTFLGDLYAEVPVIGTQTGNGRQNGDPRDLDAYLKKQAERAREKTLLLSWQKTACKAGRAGLQHLDYLASLNLMPALTEEKHKAFSDALESICTPGSPKFRLDPKLVDDQGRPKAAENYPDGSMALNYERCNEIAETDEIDGRLLFTVMITHEILSFPSLALETTDDFSWTGNFILFQGTLVRPMHLEASKIHGDYDSFLAEQMKTGMRDYTELYNDPKFDDQSGYLSRELYGSSRYVLFGLSAKVLNQEEAISVRESEPQSFYPEWIQDCRDIEGKYHLRYLKDWDTPASDFIDHRTGLRDPSPLWEEVMRFYKRVRGRSSGVPNATDMINDAMERAFGNGKHIDPKSNGLILRYHNHKYEFFSVVEVQHETPAPKNFCIELGD